MRKGLGLVFGGISGSGSRKVGSLEVRGCEGGDVVADSGAKLSE